MGIFATSNILQENFSSNTIIPMNNFDESYFSLSLQYCKMLNEEYDNANKTLYKSLLESGDNYELINESFDGFFNRIKDIVAKFIKFLKNLIDKFSTKLHQLVKSDKYIAKNEKLINTFSSDNEFDMKLFNFTFLDDINIPLAIAGTTFEEEFNKIKLIVDPLSKDDPNSIVSLDNNKKLDVLKKYYRDMVDDDEDCYDNFRAKVLGEDRPISSSDYASDLYKKFRDGDDTPSTTTVDSGVVTNALLRFKSYDKNLKSVKEIQKKLDKDYNNISKNVEKIISSKDGKLSLVGFDGTSNFEAGKYSSEIISELNMIAKAQSNKVQVMSNIHLQAMGAKLDAMTACFKQDKAILYKAISELQKWKNVKNESTITVMESAVNVLDHVSEYESFMRLESYNQSKMDDYIKECLAIESHNSDVLHYITEGALDKIKDFIQRVIEAITKFFGKVTESISATFKSDQAYLTKYKDIILNKEVKLGEITDYYEIKTKELIQDTPIPEFNYQALSGKLTSEEEFRKTAPFNVAQVKGDQKYSEAIKLYFLGEPKNIDSSKLNMTDLYNFCWGADKTIERFNKDKNTLEKSKVNAIKIADQFSKTNPTSDNSGKGTTDLGKPNVNNDTNNNQDKKEEVNNASYVFSNVYGGYISESVLLELGIGDKDKSNNKSNTPNAPASNNDMSKNVNTTYGRKDDNLTDAIKDSNNPEEASKRITVYFNVAEAYFMAKIAALEKAYSDYMEIIRAHVRTYVGTKDADKKDHATVSTKISFDAPNEALNSLNDNQKQKYFDQVKAAKNAWKKYYGIHNGTIFYSKEGQLANKKYTGTITDDNREEVMKELIDIFTTKDEVGKAYAKYWKETFEDKGYSFPLKVEDSELSDDELSKNMKNVVKDNNKQTT